MPKTVLFDLDGTLLDTLQSLADSTNEALRELGFAAHPIDAYRYLVGEGMTELARRALPEAARDEATVAQALAGLTRCYSAGWQRHTHPYEGIPDLLDALTARQVQFAVISNKADEFTQRLVQHYFARWPWAAVHGSRPQVPRKPDPTVAHEVLTRLGATPAEAFFVGDTNIDMRTALAASMVPVGVLWGFRDAAELQASGARYLLAAPHDLLAIVDR
jgi:phosphoglycolate phosphatase